MTIYELQNALTQYALYVLAALVFVEYLSIPRLPRGIVIPLMGVMSRMGIFSFESGFTAAVAASVLASLLIYTIGYAFPAPCMKFYSRRQKGVERFQTVEKMTKKYGRLMILRCRLYSAFRTFVSIPSGILRTNVFLYFFSTLVGNALDIFISMLAAGVLTVLII